ncbi:hypothetical protein ACJD0Z_06455 [Flavobacteriaceae bacterium M23B6Z8]
MKRKEEEKKEITPLADMHDDGVRFNKDLLRKKQEKERTKENLSDI